METSSAFLENWKQIRFLNFITHCFILVKIKIIILFYIGSFFLVPSVGLFFWPPDMVYIFTQCTQLKSWTYRVVYTDTLAWVWYSLYKVALGIPWTMWHLLYTLKQGTHIPLRVLINGPIYNITMSWWWDLNKRFNLNLNLFCNLIILLSVLFLTSNRHPWSSKIIQNCIILAIVWQTLYYFSGWDIIRETLFLFKPAL